MKNFKRLSVISVYIFLAFMLFADDCDLKKVPKDFLGTYMPVQMEMLLKEYMSYEKALNAIAESSYDVLSLEPNICYSQVRFEDGYAVKAKDFANWSFVKRGEERFILDENGLSYRRISKKKHDFEAYAERVLSIIFADAIHNKNISIEGQSIQIYDKNYYFDLAASYADDANENGTLYLSGAVLKIEGVSANIYRTESADRWSLQRTDEIVQTIPLFYWDDANYDYMRAFKYRESKKDLRLLRNLVYAKHGYKFKTEDLKGIFNDFDWYKPDDNFSEASFTNWEKNLIKDIQSYETE